MIKGKVLTILAALLGVTAACSLGVAAYIIIQPETSPENGVAETEAQLAGVEIVDHTGEEEHIDNDALPDISVDDGAVWTDSESAESDVDDSEHSEVNEDKFDADQGLNVDQQTGWGDAYIEYLNNFYDENMGVAWNDIKDYYHFSLIDITGNGIPEMFLITDMQWLPCIIVYYDGNKACDAQWRYVQSFYVLPGENLIRVELFVKGLWNDYFYRLDKSYMEWIKQGSHSYYRGHELLEKEEFYWDDHPVSGEEASYIQLSEEDYNSIINDIVDINKATIVDRDTWEYSSADELTEAIRTMCPKKSETALVDKYRPYKLIALKAKSNNCYVSCDIGEKEGNGKYSHYDDPTIRVNASKIQWYEMFYLIPIDENRGYYALQSDANRQYLRRDYYMWWRGLKAEDDFIEEKNKVKLNLSGKYTTIQFIESRSWVTRENDLLKWSEDDSKAEQFEIVYLDDNAYDETEKEILTSSEWFDLDGKGVGYWNVQDEIGRASTQSLLDLGYTAMTVRGKNRRVLENGPMQCAVGVKLRDDGVYDVLITFQGTGGENYNFAEDKWDGIQSITGVGLTHDGMHQGYTYMAGLFEELEDKLVATVNGVEIKYKDLIEKSKDEKAQFMLLGHSMGGAIAQIYAKKLVSKGVPSWQIRGRTFNPALAIAPRDVLPYFEDWYNICVSTDSVTSGLVTYSIAQYGICRLGKTIWLYDDEPAEGIDRSFNIAGAKHNMDQKLKEILSYYVSSAQGK